ncbi:MAG: hypothetical protein CM15mP59_3130 [Flavobacteriaceae bacterium]|nr:MAG: hypothetical protein CM15mP59_3130 [Flavobacteriaceae bacterium]
MMEVLKKQVLPMFLRLSFQKREEINRIVEFPIISLEQDILDILQDKGYKHAYDF